MLKPRLLTVAASLVTGLVLVAQAANEPLTVYEIQSNTFDGDASAYQGQVIDCTGGIVVGKFAGTRPRIVLQDPAYPDGWGGIQVKDWTLSDLYDHVQIGDWVTLTNVKVEDYRGTTFLQWQSPYNPGFSIVSRNNSPPDPIEVEPSMIPAPIPHPFDEWYVENHDAELYESMLLRVQCIDVTAWNLGKAVDNYNLKGSDGSDCWAADYMNLDAAPTGYHPYVHFGQHFCAVTGVFEQYTSLRDGWDYYQLVTLRTGGLSVLGDADGDGDVQLDDWPRFEECFTGPYCDHVPGGCDPPEWTFPPLGWSVEHCWMMDTDCDGDVDLFDAAVFGQLFPSE